MFWRNYAAVFDITDEFVEDVTKLYLKELKNTDKSVMEEIVRTCPSVRVMYRCASEMAFGDIVRDLLEGDSMMFLKDTVWKYGYNVDND